MKRAFLIGLIAAVLLASGCVTNSLKVDVTIDESGGGKVFIESEIDDSGGLVAPAKLGMREGMRTETEDVPGKESTVIYRIWFDFEDVSELDGNASFERVEEGKIVRFIYDDVLSAESVAGDTEEAVDFELCITLPGKITKLEFEGTPDNSFNGKSTACVEIDGSRDNPGQSLHIESESPMTASEIAERQGCLYNNPACGEGKECINNACVKPEQGEKPTAEGPSAEPLPVFFGVGVLPVFVLGLVLGALLLYFLFKGKMVR